MKPAVATLAAADPQLRRVLDDLGIDYTSLGSLSLDDAAAAAGFPLSTVLQRLGREPLTGTGGGTWLDATLSRLVAHLSAEHTQLRFGVLRTTAAAFDEATEALGEDHPLLETAMGERASGDRRFERAQRRVADYGEQLGRTIGGF